MNKKALWIVSVWMSWQPNEQYLVVMCEQKETASTLNGIIGGVQFFLNIVEPLVLEGIVILYILNIISQ